MKVEISIDKTCTEPKVVIVADRMTDEINELVERLLKTHADTVTAFSDRGVELLDNRDIIRIYAQNQKVFAQTGKGTYAVRARLYELEEMLDSRLFVRISNSEIVNIRKIDHMDVSLAGTICVYLKGNVKTYTSRRYVARIKQMFGI